MPAKASTQLPKSGISDKKQMIAQTIKIIDELQPEGRNDAALEAIYNLIDRPDGKNYDDFKFFFQRLTEFFFLPENSTALCKSGSWLKPKDVYTMLYDLDLFLEEVNFWTVSNQVQKYELTAWGTDLTLEAVTNIHARFVKRKQIEDFKKTLK